MAKQKKERAEAAACLKRASDRRERHHGNHDVTQLAGCAADQHLQHRVQLRGRERFRKKDHSAGGKTIRRQFRILFGSHHHHRNLHVPFFRFHETHELRSGNMWHHYVKDCRREILIALQNLVCFPAVARRDDAIVFFFENGRD